MRRIIRLLIGELRSERWRQTVLILGLIAKPELHDVAHLYSFPELKIL